MDEIIHWSVLAYFRLELPPDEPRAAALGAGS
jgi:hypothetical protein